MTEGAALRYNLEHIETLFEALEGAGFKVGPAGRGRALTLITELLADDALPVEPESLAGWLQPIVVTSGRDRARFLETVLRWSDSAVRVERVAASVAAPKSEQKPDWRAAAERTVAEPPPRPPTPWWRTGLAAVRRWWIPAVLAVFVCGVVALPQTRALGMVAWHWVEALMPMNRERVSTVPEVAPEATVATVAAAPVATETQQSPAGAFAALVAELRFRASAFGYAPTLRELATPPADLVRRVRESAPVSGGRVNLAFPVRDLGNGQLQVTDVATGQNVQFGPVTSFVQSASGALLVVFRPDGKAEAIALADPTKGATDLGLLGDMAVAPDTAVIGDFLIATMLDGQTAIVDLTTGARGALWDWQADAMAARLGIDADRPLPLYRADVASRVLMAATDATVPDEELDGVANTIAETAAEGMPAQVLGGGAAGAISKKSSEELQAEFTHSPSVIDTSADGTQKSILTAGGMLVGIKGPDAATISDVVYSRDGKLRATIRVNDPVLRVTAGSRQLASLDHGSAISRVNFSDDGASVVTVGSDGAAKIWGVTTGELLRTISQAGGVAEATFSHSGDFLLTTGVIGGAKIWNASNGNALRTLGRSTDPMSHGVFSRDERFIITTGSAIEVWDAAGGGLLVHFPQPDDVSRVAISRDGEILAAKKDGAIQVWRPAALQPDFTALMDDRRAIGVDHLDARVRTVLKLPPDDDLAEPAQRVTAEDIARAVALYGWDTGHVRRIRDAPWLQVADAPSFWEDTAPWPPRVLLAALAALGAIGLWIAAALNTRAFLARRKPDDPGRIADLAAEDRARAERADQPLRLAARRMLERTASVRQLDVRGTVDATARAGGFFTPLSRPGHRIPEYLFLIDMRARADHDARRALQYVERLRAENVKVDVYFFERAPDRVRETPTSPLVLLETIVSSHATQRLVIVGDAAAMLEDDGRSVGPWAETIAIWEERAVLTTVPADEWGREEETLALALRALVRPLSTAALSDLPAQLRDDAGDGESWVLPSHDLAGHPLPAALRETPHRWLSESPVTDETLEACLADLKTFMGVQGYRWVAACAVYPAIDYDLTMALGYALKDADGAHLVSETRVALISQLPWMRAGQMPDWLRARFIGDMDAADRQEVRAFIARLLDAARFPDRAVGAQRIQLSFSVEGGRGRRAFDDEVFVSFLLGTRDARDPRALDATRQVRNLLLPPLVMRLLRPQELGILLGGLVLAVGAYLVTPLVDGAPLKAGALWPLLALVAAPFFAMRIVSGAVQLWDALRNWRSLAAALPQFSPRTDSPLQRAQRRARTWTGIAIEFGTVVAAAALVAVGLSGFGLGALSAVLGADRLFDGVLSGNLLGSMRADYGAGAMALGFVGFLGVSALLAWPATMLARALIGLVASRPFPEFLPVSNGSSGAMVRRSGLAAVLGAAFVAVLLVLGGMSAGVGAYVAVAAPYFALMFARQLQYRAVRERQGFSSRFTRVDVVVTGKQNGFVAARLRERGVVAMGYLWYRFSLVSLYRVPRIAVVLDGSTGRGLPRVEVAIQRASTARQATADDVFEAVARILRGDTLAIDRLRDSGWVVDTLAPPTPLRKNASSASQQAPT